MYESVSDDHDKVGAIYTDLSKAFDRLHQDVALQQSECCIG